MNNINASWMPPVSSFPNISKSPLVPSCEDFRNFGFILSAIIINAVMSFVTFLMNFLIIWTFGRTSSVRALSSNVLVFGLAFSDLLVGAVVQPLFCVLIFAELKFGKTADISQSMSRIFQYSSYQLASVSFFTLSAITVDRFLAVHLHLRYKELVTSKRCGIALACIWLASLSVYMQDILTMRVFVTLTASLLLVVLTINLYMIFKISREIHRHSVQIQAQQQSVQKSIDMPRYKKSVKTMYYVIAAFLLCYVPHVGAMMAELINESEDKPRCGLLIFIYFSSTVSTTLVLSNSVINPIIYCWRIQEMRQAVKRLIRGIWKQEGGQ